MAGWCRRTEATQLHTHQGLHGKEGAVSNMQDGLADGLIIWYDAPSGRIVRGYELDHCTAFDLSSMFGLRLMCLLRLACGLYAETCNIMVVEMGSDQGGCW